MKTTPWFALVLSFSIFNASTTLAVNGSAARKIPNDPRRPLDRRKYPEYNPIGIVKSDFGRGSGWLGSSCLVWTNKHVIGEDKKIIGQKVTFYVGQGNSADQIFEHAVEGVVVASGNPGGDADHIGQDWALIKLETSIGKIVGHIGTAKYSVVEAGNCTTLEYAGFPGEKSFRHLWWQGECALTPRSSGLSAFNIRCPITPGNSGGPLLCRETDGRLYAIGIATGSLRRRPYVESFALNFAWDWANATRAFLKYNKTCD